MFSDHKFLVEPKVDRKEAKESAPEYQIEDWEEEIAERALEIVSRGEKVVINAAGASASGKGKSSEILQTFLESKGLRVLKFSTDEFYKGIAMMMAEKLSGKIDGIDQDIKGISALVKGVIEPCKFADKFSSANMANIRALLETHYPEYNAEEIVAILEDEFSDIDFDTPEAVDLAEVNRTIHTLVEEPENMISLPQYSMYTGERAKENTVVKGQNYDAVLVEGIYGLNNDVLKEFSDRNEIATFIDADYKTFLMRKMRRDVIYGRSSMPPETVLFSLLEIVLPAYEKHILPDRKKADLILKNEFTESEAMDTKDYDVQDKLEITEDQAEELKKMLGEPIKTLTQEDFFFCNEGSNDHEPEHLIRVRLEDGVLQDLVHKSKKQVRDDGKVIRPTEAYIKAGEFGHHYDNIYDLVSAFHKAGFRLAAKLKKDRKQYAIDGVEVMVDSVDGLGTFVELRTNNQIEAAPEIDTFKEKYGLNEVASVGPYVDVYFKKMEKEDMTPEENEVKLKLESLPEGLSGKAEIHQPYLDISVPEVRKKIETYFPDKKVDWKIFTEARIRAKGKKSEEIYFLTLKTPGGVSRGELETEISREAAEEFASLPQAGVVNKDRFKIKLEEDLVAEVDDYKEGLKGLVTVEAEFDPKKYKREEIIEKLKERFGKEAQDVTDDPYYRNSNLAKINQSFLEKE